MVFSQLKSTTRIKKAFPSHKYADIELHDQHIRVKVRTLSVKWLGGNKTYHARSTSQTVPIPILAWS